MDFCVTRRIPPRFENRPRKQSSLGIVILMPKQKQPMRMVIFNLSLQTIVITVVKGYIRLKMGNIKLRKKEQGESETLFDEMTMEL